MIISQKTPPRRYGLLIFALLLLFSGGATLFWGMHNFILHFVGLVMIVASTYFFRISRFYVRSSSSVASGPSTDFKTSNGPGRLLWVVSIALLLLAGASYLNLYRDALNGYHEVAPVYIFAGVGVLCAVVWSYLASRIIR